VRPILASQAVDGLTGIQRDTPSQRSSRLVVFRARR
jgi:hypothetical protein